MTRQEQLNAIALDLNACDIGAAFTRGKVKAKYVKHRKECFAAIKKMNEQDGLANMTDDELLAALA